MQEKKSSGVPRKRGQSGRRKEPRAVAAEKVEPESPAPSAETMPSVESVAPKPAPTEPTRSASPWASLAAVGILALALAARLAGLGEQPLQPGEAANAWQSLAILKGTGGSSSAGPTLVYGETLLFFLFGASDPVARLLPTLVGTAMVALPLLVEAELGVVGARAAMLLLAISPTLVHYSRQDDPAILVAAAALTVVVCLVAAARRRNARLVCFAAAAGALLMATGPLGWYALAVLVGYAVLRFVVAPPRRREKVGPSGDDGADPTTALPFPFGDRGVLSRAGLVLGVTLLAVTTGLLTNLHGVQEGLGDGFAGWLRSLVVPSGQLVGVYVAILATYELPALAFGLVGVGYVGRKGGILPGLLSWWALFALALATLGAERPLGLAPLLVTPFALLGGVFAGDLALGLRERQARVDLGWFALVGTILLAGLSIALNHVTSSQPVVPDFVVAVPVLLIAGALAAALSTWGPQRTVRMAFAFGFAALVLFGWRVNAMVNYRAEANPADLLVGTAVSPDVRTLAKDVAEVSAIEARNGDDSRVAVSPELGAPLLWYLRGVDGLSLGDASAGGPGVAVQVADANPPRGRYAGQTYRLTESASLDSDSWKAIWRWYAYREAPALTVGQNATVYVRGAGSR